MSVAVRSSILPAEDLWAGLSADHPDLLYEMVERLRRVAAMEVTEREAAIASLLDFEAGLPQADLRVVMAAKLRALIVLEASEAETILRTIDTFLGTRPAEFSMRRMVALQGACRDLTLEELSRIETLMPSAREHAGLLPSRNGHVFVTPANGVRQAPARPRRWLLSRLFSRP
jgi:hypothetical protein